MQNVFLLNIAAIVAEDNHRHQRAVVSLNQTAQATALCPTNVTIFTITTEEEEVGSCHEEVGWYPYVISTAMCFEHLPTHAYSCADLQHWSLQLADQEHGKESES